MDSLGFKVVDFAIQLAVILFAISFHESAHAWSALQFGDTTARDQGRISLNPIRHIDPFGSILLPLLLYFTAGVIFGYAKPTPVDLRNTRNPRLASMVVSAAGPLSNFLLAILGVLALLLIRRTASALNMRSIAGPLWEISRAAVGINIGLAIFNLIPLPPLDGGGVVVSLLGPTAQRAFYQMARVGFVILILLSFTGMLGALLGPIFRSINVLISKILA